MVPLYQSLLLIDPFVWLFVLLLCVVFCSLFVWVLWCDPVFVSIFNNNNNKIIFKIYFYILYIYIYDIAICVNYNTGKSALPDIYAQRPRVRSTQGRVRIYQAEHECLCFN